MLQFICLTSERKLPPRLVKLPPKLLCIPKGIKALPLCWGTFSLVACKCKFIDQPGHSRTEGTLKGFSPSRSSLCRHSITNHHTPRIGSTYCRQHAAPLQGDKPSSACVPWPSPVFTCLLCPHRHLINSTGLLRSPEDHTTETALQRWGLSVY